MIRPDRVKALVNMSVEFHPRNPSVKTVDAFKALFGEDYYICRFQVRPESKLSMSFRVFI